LEVNVDDNWPPGVLSERGPEGALERRSLRRLDRKAAHQAGRTWKRVKARQKRGGAVQDVIRPANFCDDRLSGSGVARG